MSAIEVIKEKERRLTRQDWMRSHKQTLVLRCAAYGLSTTGKKPALAERLMAYLHPSEERPGTSQGIESDQSDTEEGAADINIATTSQAQTNIPSVSVSVAPIPTVPAYTTGFDIENIRAMIRQEMGNASFPSAHQQALPSHANLSPASLIAPSLQQPYPTSANNDQHLALNTTTFPGEAQLLTQPAQGNFNTSIKSGAVLPPLSEKALKAIKNREYVDLNSLRPHFLYDTVENPSSLSFQLNPQTDGEGMFSLSSVRSNKQKINNASTWLEAWNIFIRAMVHFHPELAPELLAYQETICGYQRMYPASSWLKYDTAFRMNLGIDKTLSWARFDGYAYNRFIRGSGNQTSKPKLKCFKCSSEDHLANACPNETFRPTLQNSFRSSSADHQEPKLCRHFNANKCAYSSCKFAHTCFKCKGNHPAIFCQNTGKKF